MNGRMTKSERNRVVDDFIKRCDPYKSRKTPKFDLRGYADYLKKNHISGMDVTPEMMQMFAM